VYAVIKTGGKQYRVSEGQRLEVERLVAPAGEAEPDDSYEVTFIPVLVVDGETVVSSPADLASATVSGRVIGEALGPKITGFTYKNKTRQRRHWGHRQRYAVVEITGISKG
jgi:large subunit ribosomal protein L21